MGEKKSEQYFIIFFFHRGQEIGAVEGSRIMRGLRDLATKSTNSRKGWNLSQIVTMGFYLTCNFGFSEFNGGVPCTDKTMGFSVRAESVVELQLSRNVIRVKTSSENPKLSHD